jgi:hypothetical protein
MDIRAVNIGTSANDGTGESIRSAFDKVNNNFNQFENYVVRYNHQTPNTGFDIDIDNEVGTLILDPAGTLATGTITMPDTPYDGQVQRICTSATITSLTVNGNTGQTIKNPPSTLTAGSGCGFIYRSTNTTWYRLY